MRPALDRRHRQLRGLVAGGRERGRVVGSADHKVYTFDAAGATGCSGRPKTCAPLWTATTGNIVGSSPAVANGVMYVGSDDGNMYAFDAAGTTGCSGSPKTCTPLWTATTGNKVGSSPAVANGVVYVGSADHKVYTFSSCSNPESSIGFAPCEIQNTYRLPSYVGGVGKTVAIVDAHHDPNAASDLAVYRSSSVCRLVPSRADVPSGQREWTVQQLPDTRRGLGSRNIARRRHGLGYVSELQDLAG